jgi:hypothetical protein
VLPQGKLALKPKALALGPVPVGVSSSAKALVSNLGLCNTSWRVLKTSNLSCIPTQATVRASDTEALEIVITPDAAGSLSGYLIIEVRDGTQLHLPVTAEAEVPQMDVLEPAFHFGKVYRGAHQMCSFTICNTSSFATKIVVDLRDHSAFSLSIPQHNWSTAGYDQCPLQQVKATDVRESRCFTIHAR